MPAFGHGEIVDGASNFKENKVEHRKNKRHKENKPYKSKRRSYGLKDNGQEKK